MNVLHISTCDVSGGAARAAYRLHTGLRRLGYDSSMFVASRDSDDPTVKGFAPPGDILSRCRRLLRRELIARSFAPYRATQSGYEPFRDDRSQYRREPLKQLPECDLINLHWVARFVDYRSFFAAVAGRIPVVWTLHDMNPFTGGCHYDNGCGRFGDRCGACPRLGSAHAKDLSRRVWRRKREAFKRIPQGGLHIVTPSRWLAAEARRSSLLGGRPVRVIPNGVDTEDFAPRDRTFARRTLGIPQEARAVLFAAQAVGNERKGFDFLRKALAGLAGPEGLFLLSLGSGEFASGLRTPHIHLGRVDHDRMLSLVYSAADLFVIPSVQDNLPNTVLESLACGMPVVGFDVGGIPDMVRPGVTGLLAPPGDVAALREAISELLKNDAKRKEMSANCRRIAAREYALEVQARRYVELYEQVLS